MRVGWTEIGHGASVPNDAVTRGPDVTWNHIDGPLLHWAGNIHWLTLKERVRVVWKRATIDDIACERWPHLADLRSRLNASATADSRAAASPQSLPTDTQSTGEAS